MDAEASGWDGWGAFKPILAEAIVERLAPLQARYREIVREPQYLRGVLADGAEAADAVAAATLLDAKRAMGFAVAGDELPADLDK